MHVKGKTECYECQPKPAPKSYPVCTITSTPSKVLVTSFLQKAILVKQSWVLHSKSVCLFKYSTLFGVTIMLGV